MWFGVAIENEDKKEKLIKREVRCEMAHMLEGIR